MEDLSVTPRSIEPQTSPPPPPLTQTSPSSSSSSSMGVKRIRVVEGSCWSCRKRRIKCDLAKPRCERCCRVGATCEYAARPIRWCTKPTAAAPARFQVVPSAVDQLAAPLGAREKRALTYFAGRFWPLLTTTPDPCALPMVLVLEHRVLLLTACLVADTHRVLQDGRNSRKGPQLKRLECLSAVRSQLNEDCSSSGDEVPWTGLLLAVLLLYFHDGYLECAEKSASTASHHAGANAIIERLGGVEVVLDTGPEALHLLVSEFASTDLTTAMLNGGRPSFSPQMWDKIDRRSVWWSRDPNARFLSLATVLGCISSMVHYLDDVNSGLVTHSDERVREFEMALTPTYAGFSTLSCGVYTGPEDEDLEAVHAYALTRSFQHAGLIYLYRAICGLPMDHWLVQQHVLPCLDCILNVKRPSKVVNCALFPLLVAGTHVQSARHQREIVNVLNLLHDRMKFASVQSVSAVLNDIWNSDPGNMAWFEMFTGLGTDAAVL
ncbi:uncharacterized protein E0L32_004566 [Thyridium curvatum]|uniref:Zn(2)-C6 fungal-type domain-containing protein n=1 Tax=Thyridium curvatum TaxID=1093900 RepID=A0A507BD07_9PEZI|nr:uncharacterized protein E0L32_004566 [Thyridium curvatum]TPX15289.1 hypothetical protein E0L32_004566 [Thyridium curvatum]